MGNLCSKSANKDPSPSIPSKPAAHPFSNPGRTLSSAPPKTPHQPQPQPQPQPTNPHNPRAQIPKTTTTTIGGGGAQGRGAGGEGNNRIEGRGEEARSAAARAAEARAVQLTSARTANAKGKLGRELEKQRAQTRTGTLQAESAEERRRREVEGLGEAREWN